jgi:hypothetical protein
MFAELTTLRTPGGTAAIVIMPRLSRVSRLGDRDTVGRPGYPRFLRGKCNAEGKRDSRSPSSSPSSRRRTQGKADRCRRATSRSSIEIVDRLDRPIRFPR